MKRSMQGLLLSLVLVGCSQQHDARYYTSHPKALEQALSTCPARTTVSLSCETLEQIHVKMNQLMYQLQDDQLAYGRHILALQEQAAEYKQQLQTQPDPEKAIALKAVELQIQERLLAVQWLESPRNRT